MSSHPHLVADAKAAATDAIEHPANFGLRQWSGWVLGPGALLITLLVPPPDGLSAEGWRTAGVALLMAVFWICESVPIPVTALLPLGLFPALHLGDIRETAAPFANPVIYLFLGGFLIALAMQRWGLHRRVAINLIGAMGTRPARLVGGFLLASAVVSMWVSNTATALMMLPIAVSIIQMVPATGGTARTRQAFAAALMLAVAYGATTGGMATLIGTPPNALLAAYVGKVYGFTIGFGQWMLLGVPVVLVTLPIVYLVLTRVSFKLDRSEIPGMAERITTERSGLGSWSRGEIGVLVVFVLTALGWIFQPLLAKSLPLLNDTTIAIMGGLLLFFIPINLKRGEFLMNWETTKGLPWDVLLLFGGGLSLAGNIEKHGLSRYLGTLCAGLEGIPMMAILGVVCFGILMLTELTSNTATAATFLPVVAALGTSLGENPLFFLIPAALAANCSYMLPVGTPPNAIVFGSGHVALPQMARAGIWLNVLLVPIMIGLVLLVGRVIFAIEPGVIPAWVR
ncbi:MAG: DASS family sodium-coupled anion symporter [Opitutaceae bacterium]|nr:DASS family sodium-coupled anion symporter [Opitutaceae bacterium]